MIGRSRVVAGGVVLLLLCLPASDLLPVAQWHLHVWSRLRQAARGAPDSDWDREYRKLRPFLPPNGAIGFVNAVPGDSARVLYFLQYSLAPRQVVQSAAYEFVIESGGPPGASVLRRDAGFALVQEISDELRVFRRISR